VIEAGCGGYQIVQQAHPVPRQSEAFSKGLDLNCPRQVVSDDASLNHRTRAGQRCHPHFSNCDSFAARLCNEALN
jgi:hypothetical protein